jgi:type I restriction enzyme, R subunit
MKFPRRGIRYEPLSNEEKAHWESLDWGDRIDIERTPDEVNASAVNKWLFNADTVDKVLQTLMERGHKVNAGDRLGKTIIFARIIDNQAKYPQTLIDDFSIAAKDPQISLLSEWYAIHSSIQGAIAVSALFGNTFASVLSAAFLNFIAFN